MKRLLIILTAAILLAVIMTACAGNTAPQVTEPEPQPQLHTVAPASTEPTPEWAHVDAAMVLEDADNIYARGTDFVCFALIGNSDSARIVFKLDDVTAGMLREQSADNAYYLTMNDERIGDAELNKNCDEVTLVGDYSYEKLCELANSIRGLWN